MRMQSELNDYEFENKHMQYLIKQEKDSTQHTRQQINLLLDKIKTEKENPNSLKQGTSANYNTNVLSDQ